MKKIIAFIVFAHLCHYSFPQWTQQESGTDLSLSSISIVDENNGWIAGALGTILYYDGSNWTESIIDTNINFRSIHAVDTNNIWVTGEGTIYFNDGNEWILQYDSDDINLNGIFALDSAHAWAVGDNGTILFYNGLTWLPQISATAEDLYDVCFIDDSNGWAVGGQLWWSGDGIILNYNDSEWHIEASAYGGLVSVSFIDANHGWAVGCEAFCMFYNGNEWEYIEVWGNNSFNYNSKDVAVWFTDIYMTTSTCGWIIGGVDGPRWGGGLHFQCASGNWGGYIGPFGRDQYPQSVAFLDSLNGWMIGSEGLIFYTENGGIVDIAENNYNTIKCQAYPNPFYFKTTISFSVENMSKIVIKLYSINGSLIRTVLNDSFTTGNYTIELEADNIPAGIYLYYLLSDEDAYCGKLIKK
jgi:photosystem II stability/assembly factor-like uncharacterized protein